MEGVYPHIYGKLVTKPYRKMGHITIIDDNLDAAKEKRQAVCDVKMQLVSNKEPYPVSLGTEKLFKRKFSHTQENISYQ